MLINHYIPICLRYVDVSFILFNLKFFVVVVAWSTSNWDPSYMVIKFYIIDILRSLCENNIAYIYISFRWTTTLNSDVLCWWIWLSCDLRPISRPGIYKYGKETEREKERGERARERARAKEKKRKKEENEKIFLFIAISVIACRRTDA